MSWGGLDCWNGCAVVGGRCGDYAYTVMTAVTMMPATVIPGCCPYSRGPGTGAAATGVSSAAPVTVGLVDRGACLI